MQRVAIPQGCGGSMKTMCEGNGPQAYARSGSQLDKEGGRHRGNGT